MKPAHKCQYLFNTYHFIRITLEYCTENSSVLLKIHKSTIVKYCAAEPVPVLSKAIQIHNLQCNLHKLPSRQSPIAASGNTKTKKNSLNIDRRYWRMFTECLKSGQNKATLRSKHNNRNGKIYKYHQVLENICCRCCFIIIQLLPSWHICTRNKNKNFVSNVAQTFSANV